MMLRQRMQAWSQRWLLRRIPPLRQQRLGQHQLFILPTRLGVSYGLSCFAIFILGTNYQNNLVLLLAYALASLFVAAMWLTHRNLVGLQLLGGGVVLGEVGSSAPITITLTRDQPCYAIALELADCHAHLPMVDDAPQTVTLPVACHRRGRLPLARLKVESRYPLGLFRCWSMLDLELEAWAAPAPRYGQLRSDGGNGSERHDGRGEVSASIGDFSQLRDHQPGDPLSRIAWKQLAQGRGLLVKCFSEPEQSETRLTLNRVSGASLDERLAVLAYWVVELGRRGQPFSLELAHNAIGPDLGHGHSQKCRMALARYGESG